MLDPLLAPLDSGHNSGQCGRAIHNAQLARMNEVVDRGLDDEAGERSDLRRVSSGSPRFQGVPCDDGSARPSASSRLP